MNLAARDGNQHGVKRLLLTGLALSWISASADMLWDFQEVDVRPNAIGGIYAYLYPSATDPKSQKTALHTANLERKVASDNTAGASLRFVLDGEKYPSAGFGLMFPESQPLDLREMESIHLHLSADSPRKVRISLSSRQGDYQTASDTGVSLGCDTTVGPDGVDWVIPAARLTWPKWVSEIPAVSEGSIFASTFAIQLNVSCQTSSGTCQEDSGWVFLDSLRLLGVGAGWPAPAQGRGCFGDSIEVSRFNSPNPKRNGLSGWWYAFSDANASDSSRGGSRILSAPDTNLADSWLPDSIADLAKLDFRLQRIGAYSGFVGLETQFGAPDGDGKPVPVNISDLTAVGFDLEYGEFPPDLGGVSFHVKKHGRYFENGAEHQIRIPFDSVPRRWCVDLTDLHQPPWSSWQLPLTPEDLMAMSWEAKLQGVASTAHGSFGIRNLRIYRNAGVAVKTAIRARPVAVRRDAGGIILERASDLGPALATVVDVRGKTLARFTIASGQRMVAFPVRIEGLAWLRYQDQRGSQTVPVGF